MAKRTSPISKPVKAKLLQAKRVTTKKPSTRPILGRPSNGKVKISAKADSKKPGQKTSAAKFSLLEEQLTQRNAELAIENARLHQETQRSAQEISTMAEIGHEISAILDLSTVLERIAARALDL